jgi:hypothetical protein
VKRREKLKARIARCEVERLALMVAAAGAGVEAMPAVMTAAALNAAVTKAYPKLRQRQR